MSAGRNEKTATQLPLTRSSVGKNSASYWSKRIYFPKNMCGAVSPHYMMRVAFKGRRLAFGLGTANKDAAARIAASIYGDLLSIGIDATLAKHRAQKPKPDNIATIGEYIASAHAVMGVRPATFHAYGRHLCRIAGDILNRRTPRRSKVKTKRDLRQEIESAPLAILSPEAIQAWRLAFVATAGNDAKKARAARISANSIIRQARSLFAPRVVKFLSSLRLPEPLPFASVEFFPRESMRYISRIDAGILMRQAREELAEKRPDDFLVMILALGAGLRRGEIDRLLWKDVDFSTCRIFIEESEHGALKSEESRGAVDIDASTAEILRGYRAAASGQFVISASKATNGEASRSWGNRYRCGTVFERVNAWLRAHGVEGSKALHVLRKEAGAIVATRDGIFAASQFLRHADIGVTAAHYADHKRRTVIDLGSLLGSADEPDNVVKIAPEKAEGWKRRKNV